MHIAIEIAEHRVAEMKSRLDSKGIGYQEIGGSIYLKDPNGLGIELLPMRGG